MNASLSLYSRKCGQGFRLPVILARQGLTNCTLVAKRSDFRFPLFRCILYVFSTANTTSVTLSACWRESAMQTQVVILLLTVSSTVRLLMSYVIFTVYTLILSVYIYLVS